MKKIAVAMLVCMLAFSFSACDSDGGTSKGTEKESGDAYKSLEEMQKKVKQVEDVEFEQEAKMDSLDYDAFNGAVKNRVQQVMKSEDNMEMAMDLDMSVVGQTMKMKMYQKNNTIYLDFSGEKMKVKKDSELLSGVDTATLSDILGITKDMISDISMSEESDDTVYKIKMDPEKSEEYIKNAGGNTQFLEEMGDAEVGGIDAEIVAGKDTLPKSMKLNYKIAIDLTDQATKSMVGKESITVNYDMTFNFKSYDSGLTIDFPDFTEYKDMEELQDSL